VPKNQTARTRRPRLRKPEDRMQRFRIKMIWPAGTPGGAGACRMRWQHDRGYNISSSTDRHAASTDRHAATTDRHADRQDRHAATTDRHADRQDRGFGPAGVVAELKYLPTRRPRPWRRKRVPARRRRRPGCAERRALSSLCVRLADSARLACFRVISAAPTGLPTAGSPVVQSPNGESGRDSRRNGRSISSGLGAA
jgi:hypothetical protein